MSKYWITLPKSYEFLNDFSIQNGAPDLGEGVDSE
jgi:hypothetical protein